jgi:hypothetical protein
MLTHWVRDRSHDQLTLEFVVNKMTAQTAALYGLGDRGALVPGLLGDANVIDFDALRLPLPELVHDLPADARRFVQFRGYVATIGAVPHPNDGEDQGERPASSPRRARPERELPARFPDHEDQDHGNDDVQRGGGGRAAQRLNLPSCGGGARRQERPCSISRQRVDLPVTRNQHRATHPTPDEQHQREPDERVENLIALSLASTSRMPNTDQ